MSFVNKTSHLIWNQRNITLKYRHNSATKIIRQWCYHMYYWPNFLLYISVVNTSLYKYFHCRSIDGLKNMCLQWKKKSYKHNLIISLTFIVDKRLTPLTLLIFLYITHSILIWWPIVYLLLRSQLLSTKAISPLRCHIK